LGNNQPGFDRLSETDLICEDATAFVETSKGKNCCINLVRIWINARLALGCGIALSLIRSSNPHQVFGQGCMGDYSIFSALSPDL
jgi:hypothetical protein